MRIQPTRELRSRVVHAAVACAVLAALATLPRAAFPLTTSSAGLMPDTLRGRVTTEAGAPVPGVEVSLPALDRTAVTDADGRFVMSDLPAGPHRVVFRRSGYAPIVQEVQLANVTQLNVVLREALFVMEPVVVTGTSAPVEPIKTVMPTVTLSGEEVRADQSISIAHLLDQVAGVRTLSTGMEVGKPVIRGLSGSRVLVLENGSRLEDYSWSDEDGPSIDARLADRVEVVRGPASMLYGSDALGGVVNVIPDPVPSALGRTPFVHGTVEAYGASNNHEFGGVLKMEGAKGGWGWRAAAIGRGAEALHTPQGELENTGFGAVNGELATGVHGAWGGASIRYTRYGGEFKLLEVEGPPPSAGGMEEEAGPERKLSDDRIQATGTLLAGGMRWEAKGQWQRHSLIEVGDTPGAAPGEETTQFDLLLDTWTASLAAHHTLAGMVEGTIGVSGEHQSNDTRGPVPVAPDARRIGVAGFLLEQVSAGRLTFLGGGRYDARRVEADANATLGNAAATIDFTAFSGDIGASYQPADGLALSVNAGRGWRAPTLFELFASGPRIGEALYEIGRPDLEPETSFNLDAGARWERGRLRASLSVYRDRIHNFIYLQPTSQFIDSLRVFRHVQNLAEVRGMEATAAFQPITDLTLNGRFDLVEGINQDAHDFLPLMPPKRGTIGAEYATSEISWANRVYVGAETEIVARQSRLNPFDYETDGYTLLNLSAGIEPRLGRRPLRLDVRVHNLTDASYKDFLSRYKEFALNPGRNVVLRISTDF